MSVIARRTVWRHGAWWVAALAAVLLAAPAWAANGVLKRKNIDSLTPQELAAYEHAIQIMKDRSAKNQYDRSGYLWQAWVHNCPSTWVPKDGKEDGRPPRCNFFQGGAPADTSNYELVHPGMCEHGKDLFLPWHRAEFYYFEKILQGTDPNGTLTDSRGQTGPSTKDVTVPYWNWTRAPSGGRYPKAFEKIDSPLFHQNRNRDPIAPGSAYPYSSRHLVSYMVQFQDWPTFGGFAKGTQGGFGSFESITHNWMHSQYMAGDMGSPPTAALDPVFYSFHSYIDLLYAEWLKVNGKDTVTSQDFFLRGEQPANVPNPPGFSPGAGRPSMGQVKLYFDTKALGYEYEVAADDQLVSRAELIKTLGLEDTQDPPVFGEAARSLMARLLAGGGYQPNPAPGFVRTFDVTIPKPAGLPANQRFFARLDRHPEEADVSYQMDVYLYPKLAPFDAASEPFRNRYIVGTGQHWGTGARHQHEAAEPLRIEITRSVVDLVQKGRGGEVWNMSVAITVFPSLTTFGQTSLQATPPLP